MFLFIHAVTGHGKAYDNGVLHRDISDGNIVITGDQKVGLRSALIDFDNAIKHQEHRTLVNDPITVRLTNCLSRCLSDIFNVPGHSSIHVRGDPAK